MSATLAQKYFVATRAEPSAGDESITITTIGRDREGDSVLPEGGLFDDFLKNPVLLWAHGSKEGYSAIPIGVVTGLNVQPGVGVKASFRFLENDPFADRIANAYRQNVIRASSIGFKPIKATPNGQGLDHEQWSLLELSLCSVPMNPDCIRALKSVGLTDEEIASPFPAEPLVVADPTDSIKAELATLRAEFDAVQKRGRVVSAVNESRLRAAMDALTNAGAVLTEVLAQLMPMAPDDMPADASMVPADDMPPKKPMPMMALDDAASYSLSLAEDEPTVLRLLLADDDGESVMTLVDDHGREPTFMIDPTVMRNVISEAVRDQLQRDLIGPIGETVQRALDRARGRVQ